MCLILLAYKAHPTYPLIIAANRDEFLDREALIADFWPEFPQLLAGRDVQGNGTWLGITRTGRFAALTNYRDLTRPKVVGPSRGILVRDVLLSDGSLPDTSGIEGFNLIHGPIDALRYHSNVSRKDEPLSVGSHGISNHFLDTPWPKVVNAGTAFNKVVSGSEPMVDELFDILQDRGLAPDNVLPSTGVDLDWERKLSAIFIEAANYGTRCSTVIMIGNNGKVIFEERTHAPVHLPAKRFEFEL